MMPRNLRGVIATAPLILLQKECPKPMFVTCWGIRSKAKVAMRSRTMKSGVTRELRRIGTFGFALYCSKTIRWWTRRVITLSTEWTASYPKTTNSQQIKNLTSANKNNLISQQDYTYDFEGQVKTGTKN